MFNIFWPWRSVLMLDVNDLVKKIIVEGKSIKMTSIQTEGNRFIY